MKLEIEGDSLTSAVKDNITRRVIKLLRTAKAQGFDFQAETSLEFGQRFPRFVLSNDPDYVDLIWNASQFEPVNMGIWGFNFME